MMMVRRKTVGGGYGGRRGGAFLSLLGNGWVKTGCPISSSSLNIQYPLHRHYCAWAGLEAPGHVKAQVIVRLASTKKNTVLNPYHPKPLTYEDNYTQN
jgi:hypothetical protein